MLVGVPKEIKDSEYRVGLVPSTVRELDGQRSSGRREKEPPDWARASPMPTTRPPAPRSSPVRIRSSAAPS